MIQSVFDSSQWPTLAVSRPDGASWNDLQIDFLGENPWEISGKNMRYGRFPINGGRIVVDFWGEQWLNDQGELIGWVKFTQDSKAISGKSRVATEVYRWEMLD